MLYIIYKTTNIINGKFYIGKHQTEKLDDGYLGSGKLLKRAIQRYGKENFKREILAFCVDEIELSVKEKELVVLNENSYNLVEGGQGGFGYINRNSKTLRPNNHLNLKKGQRDRKFSETHIEKLRQANLGPKNPQWGKPRNLFGEQNPMFGKRHTKDSKNKMSQSHQGTKNSQYGTCWITNGSDNKKIKKEELPNWIEAGYRIGRV